MWPERQFGIIANLLMLKITVHCLVCNEERWIWYALQSVLDYVDEIMVWDTGSEDRTVEVISALKSDKIKFRQYGPVDEQKFTQAHQEMLEQTDSDWLLWLDGDEIWTEAALAEAMGIIKSKTDINFVVHRFYNLIGDVYHYQNEDAGRYKIGNYTGHLSIRFINLKTIPGLHFDRPHGQIGLFDNRGNLIQESPVSKWILAKQRFVHCSSLIRSADLNQDKKTLQRRHKYRYEIGQRFGREFAYPAAFYLPRPAVVPSPWQTAGLSYWLNAAWQTPLKRLRRKIFNLPSGY